MEVSAWLERLRALLDYELVTIAETALTPAKIFLAVLAIVVGQLLSKLFSRAVVRYEASREPGPNGASFYAVRRVAHYLILAIAFIVGLEFIGIPATRFAVFASALGIGLGFGLQAIFNNFVSGLILLFDRSLKVGDFVELSSGVQGEVRDIRIRATQVTTNDNIDILVPNSEFVNGRVVNWTHREVSRRLRIPFAVAYGSDKERVRAAALEAAREVPFTLTHEGARAPQVWLANFGESSLDFELVVWLTAEATKRPSAVRAAYNWALESALARHELEIPFAQRDLRVRSLFGIEGAQALAALGLGAAPEPQVSEAKPARLPEGPNDAQIEVARSIDERRREAADPRSEGAACDDPD